MSNSSETKGVTMTEYVKPSREAVARILWDQRGGSLGVVSWDDPEVFTEAVKESWREAADTILALLPGRTEAEIKAEALRGAAQIAVTSDRGIPWDDDYDRATVAAWLDELADDA